MTHKVICINRQHGSGAAIAGKLAAERLGISFYNNQLLEMAIQYGDLDKSKYADIFKDYDEKAPNKMFYQLYTEGNEHVEKESPAADIIYDLEKQIIKDIAHKEDAIIMGRCAGVYLKEEPDVEAVSLFVTATPEYRKEFILKYSSLSGRDVEDEIEKVDRQRRKYFEYYAHNEWDLPDTYDMTINIGNMGIDKTINVLCGLYERW